MSISKIYYVYRISDTIKGQHYYGSRCTKLDPKDDLGIKYFSSSSDKDFIKNQKLRAQTFKYKIIKTFDTLIDCISYESKLHEKFKVSKNNKFINKANQTSTYWTNTGNKEIGRKISESLSKIDPKTGLSKGQMSGIKGKKTRSKIDPKTGLTGYQTSGIKGSIELNKIDPKTGCTYATTYSRKAATTMMKNDLENGLTIAITRARDASRTMDKIDPKTGLSTYQMSGIKGKKTRSKIDPKTGLTGYQTSGIKIKETLSKIDDISGLTRAQMRGAKFSKNIDKIDGKTMFTTRQKMSHGSKGIKSGNFKGYYVYNNNQYITSGELAKFISNTVCNIANSTVRKWCTNSHEIITVSSYVSSNFLKKLYPNKKAIGLTFKSIGFNFINRITKK